MFYAEPFVIEVGVKKCNTSQVILVKLTFTKNRVDQMQHFLAEYNTE